MENKELPCYNENKRRPPIDGSLPRSMVTSAISKNNRQVGSSGGYFCFTEITINNSKRSCNDVSSNKFTSLLRYFDLSARREPPTVSSGLRSVYHKKRRAATRHSYIQQPFRGFPMESKNFLCYNECRRRPPMDGSLPRSMVICYVLTKITAKLEARAVIFVN